MSHQGAAGPLFVHVWDDEGRFGRSSLRVREVTDKRDATHIPAEFAARALATRDQEHAAALSEQARRLLALEADYAIIQDTLRQEQHGRIDADRLLRDREADVAMAWQAAQDQAQEVAVQRALAEQLRAELETLQTAHQDLGAQNEALRAEVERLRAHAATLIAEKRAERERARGRPRRAARDTPRDRA